MREILLCLAVVVAATAPTPPPATLQVQVMEMPALGEWDVTVDFAFAAVAPLRAALWNESGAMMPLRQRNEPWLVITAFLNTADGSCPGVCYRESFRFAKVDIGLFRACHAGLETPSDLAGRTNGIAREGECEDCAPGM